MSWARAVTHSIHAAEEVKPVVSRNPTLEENFELSNVTDLRHNLLPVMERIEKNPALRVMVLKRGKPQAVLMSVPTYNLVRKLMDQLASQAEKTPRKDAIEGAIARLRSERTTVNTEAALEEAGEELPDLYHQVEAAATLLLTLKHALAAKKDRASRKSASSNNEAFAE